MHWLYNRRQQKKSNGKQWGQNTVRHWRFGKHRRRPERQGMLRLIRNFKLSWSYGRLRGMQCKQRRRSPGGINQLENHQNIQFWSQSRGRMTVAAVTMNECHTKVWHCTPEWVSLKIMSSRSNLSSTIKISCSSLGLGIQTFKYLCYNVVTINLVEDWSLWNYAHIYFECPKDQVITVVWNIGYIFTMQSHNFQIKDLKISQQGAWNSW